MFETAEERKVMEEAIGGVIDGYEEALKAEKFANDGAQSLGFAVGILHTIATGKELKEEAFPALADRFRATLDIPAVRQATDAQKQEFYEWTLCSVGLVAVLSSQMTEEAEKAKLVQLAEAQLQLLIGVSSKSLTIDGGTITLTTSKAPTTNANPEPPTTGGLAPGFSVTMPQGWEQKDGWYIARHRDKPEDSVVISALVRFPPAVPAQGNFSEAIRAAWDKHIPAEGKGKASGMIYRRYIGDGLVSQFVFARVREAGQQADTYFTLFMIDCGSTWQPMVVAFTYQDTDSFSAGADFSSQFSYPKCADMAEVFLAQLRCPAAKDRPLVDKTGVIGSYHFGSGSSMQWENIYTGATAMTFVSYGGTLDLKSDGTFNYTYSSASGVAGAAKFAGIKASGTWRIERDVLVCKYSTYDQGDSYKRTEDRYRIAGIVSFSDGNKVIVLKSKLDVPINAVTVTDSSEYYSTKKK